MQKRREGRGAQYLHYDTPGELPVRFFLDLPENARQKRFFPEHFHDQLEIAFCHEGDGVFAAAGAPMRYGPGDMVVIPPGIPHHMSSRPGVRSVWSWVFFDPLRLIGDGSSRELIDVRATTFPRCALLLSSNAHPSLSSTLVRLLGEARARKPFRRDAIRSCVSLLVVELHRLGVHESSTATAPPFEMDRIRPALDYVRDHFTEPIETRKLATVCAMSETTFRDHFRRSMGASPYQYVLAHRISMAMIALKRDQKSLRAIAVDHGFPTLSSFMRAFGKQVGTSPARWLRADRAERSSD
jgi:AraC-like DNA-binding protein